MIDRFYGAIRDDRLLGPVFAAAIGEEWTPHLAKMKAFWSSDRAPEIAPADGDSFRTLAGVVARNGSRSLVEGSGGSLH
jgi:hypothetical protein